MLAMCPPSPYTVCAPDTSHVNYIININAVSIYALCITWHSSRTQHFELLANLGTQACIAGTVPIALSLIMLTEYSQ